MLRELRPLIEEGKNLQEAEASACMEAILSQEIEDSEIARFLISLSEKGETAKEIAGFAKVMRRLSLRIESRHEIFIDTAGTGGGGDTFNISTAAAFVIAGAGLPVAKHGNRAVTSRSGSADVLEELGVKIECDASTCEKALNEIGICFMFAPGFHPAMKRVAEIRKRLGRRTIFNILGPLTNPANAPVQLVGVYSFDLTQTVAEALCRLGCKRAWIVHSHDGLDELSVAESTRVAEVREEEVEVFDFKPLTRKFGVPAGGTPAENAQIIEGILSGAVAGPAREIVVLNAAAALYLGLELRFEQAIERVEHSISSGKAAEKLKQLVALTNSK